MDVDAIENASHISSIKDLSDHITTTFKESNYSNIEYTEWEAIIYAQEEIKKATEQRNLWYLKIETGDVTPCIDEFNALVVARGEAKNMYPCVADLIQTKAQDYIDGLKNDNTIDDLLLLQASLLSSMKEFCRYIPDLSNHDASYYIDSKTLGIGATIKKTGTLSLLVHEPGCVDFSYARRAKHGGLVRLTGTANFTQHIKNSEYIDLILGLIEGK